MNLAPFGQHPPSLRQRCDNALLLLQTLALLAACILNCPALADAQPVPGDTAPTLTFTTINGEAISTDSLRGSIQVLLFGKTDQQLTTSACEEIAHALSDPTLDGIDLKWLYILSKSSDPAQAESCAKGTKRQPVFIYDSNRQAFGAYSIIALPTVIIIDDQNRFVHFMPGLSPRFSDIFCAAVLHADGRIDRPGFEQVLKPETNKKSQSRVRAERIIQLARHASKRGLDDMALKQYLRAYEVDPTYTVAALAAGYLYLKQNKLDQAEQTFHAILKLDQTSPDANLGLASVYTARRGDFLQKAQLLVSKVLTGNAKLARAHYVQGLIYEASDQTEKAAASYKQAAELLLNASSPDLKVRK